VIVETFKLVELTDFIWDDYQHNLEYTLGKFKHRSRDVTSEMMKRYIASSFPFVFSFNDFCRLITLQAEPTGNRSIHPEVAAHVRADLEHFELYKRDYLKYRAWALPLDLDPFIRLHNSIWRCYEKTSSQHYYHLLIVFEVMSTCWLRKWHELSAHHQLDFHFLGEVHLSEDDYKIHLLSHIEILEDVLPQSTFWLFRKCYDEISSGFVTWFSNELSRTEILKDVQEDVRGEDVKLVSA